MKRSNNRKGNNQFTKVFKPDIADVADKVRVLRREQGNSDWDTIATRLKYAWPGAVFEWQGKTLAKYLTRAGYVGLGPRGDMRSVPQGTREELVKAAIDADSNRLKGVLSIQQDILSSSGLRLSRDFIRAVMMHYDPEGFDIRFFRKRKLKRVALYSAGPFDNAHGDGYEKLSATCGFGVYVLVDRTTSYVVMLETRADIRSKWPVALMYVEQIESDGGMFVHYTVDKGSETWELENVLGDLRSTAAPHLPLCDVPVVSRVQSKHNTPAERFWSWFTPTYGGNMRSLLEGGMRDRACDLNIPMQRILYFWIWKPVVSSWLYEVQDIWNSHKIRKQRNKMLMSGYSPRGAMEIAEEQGYSNCFISVPQTAIDNVKDHIHASMPQEHMRDFYTDEQHLYLNKIWVQIGSPDVTQSTGWGVYDSMLAAIHTDMTEGVDWEDGHDYDQFDRTVGASRDDSEGLEEPAGDDGLHQRREAQDSDTGDSEIMWAEYEEDVW